MVWVEILSGPEWIACKKRKGENAHLFKLVEKKRVRRVCQTIIDDQDLIAKLNSIKKPGMDKAVLIIAPNEMGPK